MHLNMCGPNAHVASDDTKFILSNVDQSSPMPVTTQNVPQYVLTKPLPCQRGHKINRNIS
jgi:hypothetical protein